MNTANDDDRAAALIRIVDDDEDIRVGLSFLLRCDGWRVATYKSAEDFLWDLDGSAPGCLVLDMQMPGMSGIELQREMKERGEELPVIIVTGYGDVKAAVRTMKLGAFDFLQKPVDDTELITAIEGAVRASLERAKGAPSPEETRRAALALTPREKSVARLLKEGLSNMEIAERLGLAERTVQSHRNSVYHKMRVHSLRDLRGALSKAGL